ncbi:MAG: NAD(P)/FAD-dependent oxidoreductase [Gemmatales bacterium]|nr:NAD(P)/FAD-dependent oxidoreductase [Gemmatales bacterium]MDW7995540.1 NAD(P)/FAD-dependent oxidoreductase [Gemmatales bacterium]
MASGSSSAPLLTSSYDVIVVGAGHNGLVCAAYLARAGKRVLVLERRAVVGGACVTEELWPGFHVSVCAYVNSLFRPEIVRDLELKRHGFLMLPRKPSSFTPFPDGRYLLLGPDKDLNHREISKFSRKDADAYPKYERWLEEIAEFLEPTLLQTPPDPWSNRWRDWTGALGLGWRFRGLGREKGFRLVEILTAPARRILDRWFESEELKVTLATDAIIGAFASPSQPGTAYVLFHHVMGECDGVRGVWGYVQGGMGALTQALARAARELGATILTNAEVVRIVAERDRARGVVLADGREFSSRVVVSNADPQVTFLRLCEPSLLPSEFVDMIRRMDFSSASMKINLALAELPNFTALPGNDQGQLHGTIHICPSFDYMEQAYDDAKYGRPSQAPILEITVPSTVDATIAPPGQHLMSIFVQYAPYHLRAGHWDEWKERFADRCLEIVAQYAPNVPRAVLHRQVLSPLDLEREFRLTGGNIFHGAMTLSQLFCFRPVPGYANYRTPIRGLYLCGAGTHPGGGVMGACGYNAAREILRDGLW